MPLHIIQFTALLFLSLVMGIFWGPWFGLHRSNRSFSPEQLIHITKTMTANLAIPMRILMPASISFLVLACWFYPAIPSCGFYFSLAALILNVCALVITLVVEVPIVSQINQWNISNLPADWQAIRDRWTRFHALRVLLAIGSFACLVLSILVLSKG